MKKILSILFIVLFLASCGSYTGNGNAGKAMRIRGVLSEQSSEDSNPGTHLLLSEDLIVYPVSSILVRLSSPDYLGNKVELIGSYDESLNLFSVSGISVLEKINNIVEVDETPELVDYKNSDFGFQLKYYDNWTFVEEGAKVVFISVPYDYNDGEAVDFVEFEQFQFNYDQSVFDSNNEDTPLKSYVASFHPDISDFSKYYVKLGPDLLDSIKIDNEFGGYNVYLYRNGLIYLVSFKPFDILNVSSENSRIFNEMINSFRFIGFTVDDNIGVDTSEKVDSSEQVNVDQKLEYVEPIDDFASFESNSYSFKAVYPKKWYYEGMTGVAGESLYSFNFADNSEPSSNPLYSLAIISELPTFSFTDSSFDNKSVKFANQNGKTYFYREVNSKKYLVSGSSEYNNFMIKTILNIESLN